MPSLQSPTGPGALGAAPRAGEPDPEAFHLAGYPISGHLAATAAAPPSPVSGALISQGRGWTHPEFFPSASRLECSRLSPTTLRPAPRMKLAAQEPPAQFLPFRSCFLGTPLPPVSHSNRSQRPPPPGSLSSYIGKTPLGAGQGHGLWPRGLPSPLGPRPGPAPTLCANRIPVSPLPPTSWGPRASLHSRPQFSNLCHGNSKAQLFGLLGRTEVTACAQHSPPRTFRVQFTNSLR